jgi:MoxR-like ATPase
MSIHDMTALTRRLELASSQIGSVVVGKPREIAACLTCLLAGGHLLIEDLPGVGKTTLAHTLALTLGLAHARVQFTADLMPSDLIGVSVYERDNAGFVFHPGPVFSQVLLADEINRAGPRTQSALLEAMEEQQISVDGLTRPLPAPFFVIATQNPLEQLGTHPLPESQLDRFLMCITLGYPDAAAERELLAGADRRSLLKSLHPVMSASELQSVQARVAQVHAAPALLDYVQALIAESRNGRWFVTGLSPRAGLALLRAARAHALLAGRDYASPDDVQAVALATLAHRLVPTSAGTPGSGSMAAADRGSRATPSTGPTATAAGAVHTPRNASQIRLQAMLQAVGLV